MEEATITVDKSRQYKINAGQCQHCGNYKTWEFRVPNPKSGKMMPGHVTEEGFKINDGDCPYWAAIRAKKQGGGGGGKATFKKASPAPKQKLSVKKQATGTTTEHHAASALGVSRDDGDHVILEIGGQTARLSRDDAKDFLFDVISAFDRE